MQAALQGNSQPYVIYQQLRDTFDVQVLDSGNTDRIPADISTLLVAHPAGFPDKVQYAIDQFVMRGGHAIVFVDPLAETLTMGSQGLGDPNDKSSSNLPALFKAWGIDYDASKVVTDAELAQQVQVGGAGGAPQVVDYIAWLRATPANFAAGDPITGNLQQLNIATAGALKASQGATTKFTPLISSSSNAALVDATLVRMTQNPRDLIRRFEIGRAHV